MKKVLMAILVPLALAACGGSDSDTPETQPDPVAAGTVTITSPADGSSVMGSTITVQLSSTVTIVPAGDMTAATGHHHVFLDADVTASDVPIPAGVSGIIHKGDGSSEFTFEGLEPGEHRLIAVVADGAHTPLQPWVVDTVTFTVR